MSPSFISGLRSSLLSIDDSAVQEFVRHFRTSFGESLLAVILYGSCMNAITRRATSIYDFILVCDSYWNFYRKKRHALLNYLLPPNVYYLESLPRQSEIGGPNPGPTRLGHKQSAPARLACKYNVVSIKDLRRETSAQAGDIFIPGRLGKRVGIVYSRDDAALESIVSCITSAMRLNLALLLPTLPENIPFDRLIFRLLSLSYNGDFRIERDTKIKELFQAERDYYRRFYGSLIKEGSRCGLPIERKGETCRILYSRENRERALNHTVAFLKKSRRRSIYRWPKEIVIFGNYVEYLLRKVERSTGITLPLTKWERKLPLILGWKYFFRFKRQGLLR